MNKTAFPNTPFRFIFHFVKAQRVKFALFALTGIAWAINDSIFPYFFERHSEYYQWLSWGAESYLFIS